MWDIMILLVGFVLLVWGADTFVVGASSLATKMGISSLIIGLTVVAFGTSAPELTVSVTAGLSGSNEIAISNVLGSNIFNMLVVVGGSAIFCKLTAEEELMKRDWVAVIASVVVLLVCIFFDMYLSRTEGLLLMFFFVCVVGMQLRSAKKEGVAVEGKGGEKKDTRPVMIMLQIIVGIVCIVLGGEFVVDGATGIALSMGLSETLIGLTIIAIGTSLPELVTSLAAARRGENDIAIGNAIGSCLFNILLILGVSAVLSPIPVEMTAIFDTFILLLVCIVLYLPAKKNILGRSVGLLAVSSYILYTVFIILR
ncbi:MAG: calcium/sodium antiporter [Bacillota bacterium]